jgi:hypothetical protein
VRSRKPLCRKAGGKRLLQVGEEFHGKMPIQCGVGKPEEKGGLGVGGEMEDRSREWIRRRRFA